MYLSGGYTVKNVCNITNSNYNTYGASFVGTFNNTLNLSNALNNSQYGIFLNYSVNIYINNCTISGNTTSQVFIDSGTTYLNKCVISSVEVSGYALSFCNPYLFSQNHNNTAYSRIYTDGGQINSMATTRPGAVGNMWQMNVTSIIRIATYPMTLSLAKIAVNAGSLVTFKAWVMKDDPYNIDCGLLVKGNQLLGVPTDIIKYKNNDANTWEQLVVTFTPQEVGVIEVLAFAAWRYASSNCYIGDLTITQV